MPQLATLLSTSTSHPVFGAWSQSACLESHVTVEHDPPAQLGAPPASLHEWPQVSQFPGSTAVWTSQPSPASVLQSLNPLKQLTSAQVPSAAHAAIGARELHGSHVRVGAARRGVALQDAAAVAELLARQAAGGRVGAGVDVRRRVLAGVDGTVESSPLAPSVVTTPDSSAPFARLPFDARVGLAGRRLEVAEDAGATAERARDEREPERTKAQSSRRMRLSPSAPRMPGAPHFKVDKSRGSARLLGELHDAGVRGGFPEASEPYVVK